MLRLHVCLFLLLQGCATATVRCDAHLTPINPPAAKSAEAFGSMP
jgi:hypothetical protein